MGYRTKLDYSSNRQISQREKTDTSLSGTTIFGLPFSGLTVGPDLATSGVTDSYSNVISTFSGNSTTSVFNWFDSRMELGYTSVSAMTPSTSAITQEIGYIYTGNSYTTIDGNISFLNYSGTFFTITANYIIDLGGGNYSGTVKHDELIFVSASSIDYSGRTIWVDNPEITRTNRLIIGRNPQINYVWTCIDSEGMGAWLPNSSGGTANVWTAGTNVSSAVLSGSNGTASGQYSIVGSYDSVVSGNRSAIIGGMNLTGTTDDTVYVPNLIINTGGTASMLGINTSTPDYIIDANGNNARLVLADTYTGSDAPFKSFVFSANSSNLPQIAAVTNSYLGGFGLSFQMGVLGDDIITTSNTALLGTSGDTFISSSQKTNNLNIINRSGGTGANHIRMYAGVNSVSAASVPDFQIQGTGSTRGYIGIQTGNPQYLIDAYGSTNSRFYYDDVTSGGQIAVSATTGLPRISIISNPTSTSSAGQTTSVSFGVRAWDDASYPIYGKQGDAFIYAGIYTNGLNIISNDGSGGSGDDYIRFYAGQSTGSNDGSNIADIHIQGSGSTKGHIGIGINVPTEKLDISGNTRIRGIGASASAGALHYTSDGVLTTNTSDERLKTNITTLTNALDKIKQLRGVSYNWTEEPNGDVRIGLIAQEVNSVVPELTFVNKNSEEKYMGVHYDNIVALLIEAIKELSNGPINNDYLETQTILAEDNNIELNYNGTHQTALDGGITIKHGINIDNDVYFKINSDGDFTTNVNLIPKGIIIPEYTPVSSSDSYGVIGNFTRDDNYLYIKTLNGWKRTNLENF